MSMLNMPNVNTPTSFIVASASHSMSITPEIEHRSAPAAADTGDVQAAMRAPLTAKVNWSPSVITLLVIYGLLSAVLLATGRRDYPDLHTILDTGSFLLAGVLALLLWDMGTRIGSPFLSGLAISFAVTALLECVHAV